MNALGLLLVAWLSFPSSSAARQSPCQPDWQPTIGSAPGATGYVVSASALLVFDDGHGGGPALYVGGYFKFPAMAANGHVSRWDGASWSPLGSGMSTTFNPSFVHALASFDDGSGPALYAGGYFLSGGGAPGTSAIARWDGSSWSGLAGGMDAGGSIPSVTALTVFDDGSGTGPALYAGGRFTSAGGLPVNNIAKWDGTSWSTLGSGLSGSQPIVRAMAVFDDGSGGGPALFAGGGFSSAGGVPATRIARWDGNSWSSLGAMSNLVTDLRVFDDGSAAGPALYAGGWFQFAGGVAANRIAKWDGSSWSPVGSGMDKYVSSLGVFDDMTGSGPALFAGGVFTVAGGTVAHNVAKWDGSSWSSLASGMNDGVNAFAEFDDKSGSGPALFAGGDFTTSAAGDSHIAKWGCPSYATFCTAKTTSVCGAANISATGSPSATSTSGFTVRAQPVRGCRAGLLLYSDQPAQPGASFGGPGDGSLCLLGQGLRRAGSIDSAGTSPQTCDGVFAIDMNQFHTLVWAATGCNPAAGQNNPAGFLGNMGTAVSAQMWGRDSIATGQVVSDGIVWVVGP